MSSSKGDKTYKVILIKRNQAQNYVVFTQLMLQLGLSYANSFKRYNIDNYIKISNVNIKNY